MSLWGAICGVGVFLQKCHHTVSIDCSLGRLLCSHLDWSAWWFLKAGQTGLSCIHALRVPGSFTHQVSWCARHSQCLCFSTHSYCCRCSSARAPSDSSRSCSAMICMPMTPDTSRSTTTLETNPSHCRPLDHTCQMDHSDLHLRASLNFVPPRSHTQHIPSPQTESLSRGMI